VSARKTKISPDVADGYVKAFAEIAARIQKSIKASTPAAQLPVRMFVAGGAAQHFYTAARVSMDIDATLSKKMLLPADLDVPYVDNDGSTRVLYYDRQYNDTFALIHENANDDSQPLALPGIDAAILDVRLFTPLDLAVSKLSRFAEHDQEDIKALARAGLIDAASVKQRAEEALAGYVGEQRRVKTSIRLACESIANSRASMKRGR
jgi:plasmid stabilization system protein ParE